MATNQQTNLTETDSLETQEWLDALSSVIENEGTERAHFLLEAMIDQARRSGRGSATGNRFAGQPVLSKPLIRAAAILPPPTNATQQGGRVDTVKAMNRRCGAYDTRPFLLTGPCYGAAACKTCVFY